MCCCSDSQPENPTTSLSDSSTGQFFDLAPAAIYLACESRSDISAPALAKRLQSFVYLRLPAAEFASHEFSHRAVLIAAIPVLRGLAP